MLTRDARGREKKGERTILWRPFYGKVTLPRGIIVRQQAMSDESLRGSRC